MKSIVGYAYLDAEPVAFACRSYLDARERRLNERREQFIARAMQPGRVFRRNGRTRDEALAYLNSQHSLDDWHWIGESGRMWADRVDALRQLAEQRCRDGAVLVSAEMVDCLGDHLVAAAAQGETR